MIYFFNPFFYPSLLVTLVLAAVVGVVVPPHLQFASPQAGSALRAGAAALAASAALPFLEIFGDTPWLVLIGDELPPLLEACFWGSFAFAAYSLVTAAPAKGDGR